MALHFSLALGCGSLAVAVIVEAVFRLVHHAAPSRLTVILEVAFEIFVTLAGLMGLLLFATGHRPKEMLHLLYGLIALGAIPCCQTGTVKSMVPIVVAVAVVKVQV